jgi:hypothetical protein
MTSVAQLEHRFVPRLAATPEQVEEWLHRTGHSVCGGVMKGNRSSTQLDPTEVSVTGMAERSVAATTIAAVMRQTWH